MKKIVFIDLDGTLCVGGTLKIKKEVKDAIFKLQENNISPIISSGRSLYEIKDLLSELKINSYILSNGCYIVLENEVIQNYYFKPLDVEKILTIADNWNITTGFFNQKGYAINKNTQVVKQHIHNMGISNIPINSNFHHSNKVNFMNLYIDEDGEQVIKSQIEPLAEIERFAPLAIDVLPKGVSKGAGIKQFIEKMGISDIETYAFGDQNNDISMFNAVDFSISMKHGSEELKQIASYIAQTTEGVLEGLKYYQLI
ncbi:MAG: Cof-type HAD-IIB family hydrolase [Streptococcaceae bacterium]|jgi:Cof subfamily protein (haloacid dehalogenase superfamily)|nr:Cof-type HAD-IIB family hydrolase [Streptococcaceae bacterium]